MSKREEDESLRAAAEARLTLDPRRATDLEMQINHANLQRMVHELHVHGVELEMQNNELQQARAEREVALARYTELYDFAPIGYLTITGDGLIEAINLTGASQLGLTRSALVNRPFVSHVAPEDQERWTRFLADVKSHDGPDRVELLLRRSDGTTFHVRLDCVRHKVGAGGTAIRPNGNGFEVNIAMTDITARKNDEAKLRAALIAAEKASQAKSDFLSSMSHELRTPLSAILGFAQLMESANPPPTEAQKRNLDRILKGGWYLLELINEILDLTLIESGNAMLSMEPVSLARLMLECQVMIEPQAEARGIALSCPQDETTHFVNADPTRLKQALINLLFNAIKYNKAGGTVAVEFTPRPPDSIRISIRDTGAGLSAEQLAHLFEPFNRLGRECGPEEGTGIGLVVTKRLVEMMGGTIGVESTAGVGSAFWIELQQVTVPQPEGVDAAQPRRMQPDATRRALVLYVEDDPASLELVEQLIARRPHIRLLTAADAVQGIEYARTYQPDLILMDITLPGLSGVEAVNILSEDPLTQKTPIIALSANAIPRNIELGLEAGFFRYLTKPIRLTEFMDTLDTALKIAQRQSAGAAKS